jgi:mannitol operon repressor
MARDKAPKMPPHLKEFAEYLPEMNKESARGQVLLSASYLDELLKRTLVAFFVDDPRHTQIIDDANGPVATFSSRIRMCDALGLIRRKEADELHRIRKIRNRFSHEIRVSFEDQQIRDLCKALTYRVGDHIGGASSSARAMFGAATSSLILNLVNRAAYVAQARCKPKEWAY